MKLNSQVSIHVNMHTLPPTPTPPLVEIKKTWKISGNACNDPKQHMSRNVQWNTSSLKMSESAMLSFPPSHMHTHTNAISFFFVICSSLSLSLSLSHSLSLTEGSPKCTTAWCRKIRNNNNTNMCNWKWNKQHAADKLTNDKQKYTQNQHTTLCVISTFQVTWW